LNAVLYSFLEFTLFSGALYLDITVVINIFTTEAVKYVIVLVMAVAKISSLVPTSHWWHMVAAVVADMGTINTHSITNHYTLSLQIHW